MHYALGTSSDSNSQMLCTKQLNRLDGCFFCNALGKKRQITSPTAIGLMLVFFLFNAVNVELQKARATNLENWPCWPSSLIWSGNSLPAWIDRKLNNWLRREDALGTFWTAKLLWNTKKTGAAKRAFLNRIDKLRSYSFPSAQKFRFPLDAFFWVFLSGAIPSDDKIFAAKPNCPWRKRVFAREASTSILMLLLLFACFIEAASYQRSAYSPALHRSNLFIIEFSCCCLCFLPPLFEARKTHLLTAKNFFQLSTQSEFEMQSSMIDVIIPELGIRNFTGI